MTEDQLPRQFGPFLLFDKIGEGGMARLYLGHKKTDLGGERLVVVKQVLPLLGTSDEFCRLLTQEAKLAAQLSHRNIVQVVDLGREDDVLYIAMEYVEGFDLRDLLRECSKKRLPLPVQYALLLVVEVLRGLDYAHKKQDETGRPLGIVHRDVSPSNVLISFEGDVKLCDFGIALAFGAEAHLPEAGVQGKAGYMSPEAAAGAAIDERSDIFAAGIILWELLNGRRLYRSENRQAPTLEMAAQAVIPPLKQRGYPLEEQLHAVVMRALAKDPDRRYATAAEMRADLENYVRESSLFASPLKFGAWLTQHFAEEILARRRAREIAAKALAAGPLVKVTVSQPPPPVLPNPTASPPTDHAAGPAAGPTPDHPVVSNPTQNATTGRSLATASESGREPLSVSHSVSTPLGHERRPAVTLFAAAAIVVMVVVIALLSR